MKKKIYLLLIIFICIFTIVLIYKNKDNNLKGKIVNEERLSIMIKESGANDYTKSTSKEIPKGNYTLNEEKSHCENNGEITSYDNVNGTIGFYFIGSDRCYLYFDEVGDITPIKSTNILSGTFTTTDGDVININNPEDSLKYITVSVPTIEYETIENYSTLANFAVSFNNIISAQAMFYIHNINSNSDVILIKQKINNVWTTLDSSIVGDNQVMISLSHEGDIVVYKQNY